MNIEGIIGRCTVEETKLLAAAALQALTDEDAIAVIEARFGEGDIMRDEIVARWKEEG